MYYLYTYKCKSESSIAFEIDEKLWKRHYFPLLHVAGLDDQASMFWSRWLIINVEVIGTQPGETPSPDGAKSLTLQSRSTKGL